MAHKKIREFDAKHIISKYIEEKFSFNYKGVLIKSLEELEKAEEENPWLSKEKLVVKPDQLFGKRGKHGLVGVNLSWEEVKEWIKQRYGKEFKIGKARDVLNTFLVEPFVPHKEEYYISISSTREGEKILFSEKGGIDIEENWDYVKQFNVSVGEEFKENVIAKDYINALLKVFRELNFAYLEINPLAVPNFVPLDVVAELDDYASFKNMEKWNNIEFPNPFGKRQSKEEKEIEKLDKQSSASLKLSLLNPEGRIWLLVAGGGASIVYTDAIVELGLGKELANYGEYSGNPSKDEMYNYSKILFSLLTKNKKKRKFLIIGGAIANFTDVEKTFKGIEEALKEFKDKFIEQDITVIVRRGGINAKQGLKNIMKALDSMGIKNYVFDEEKQITYPAKLVKKIMEGEE